ncbi:hypothetical protein Nepgr_010428 [Nepenthes gracilis]|uniref:Uncharacterized protein n=1 Tax=Nepenthes gracilis TaxID=150966 RepID=A0AAD3SCJ8_NEPGR|nr:hypothetical protein Nepgr_010428 [Nepenthes gracilis]
MRGYEDPECLKALNSAIKSQNIDSVKNLEGDAPMALSDAQCSSLKSNFAEAAEMCSELGDCVEDFHARDLMVKLLSDVAAGFSDFDSPNGARCGSALRSWIGFLLHLAVESADDGMQTSSKMLLEWLILLLVSGCCCSCVGRGCWGCGLCLRLLVRDATLKIFASNMVTTAPVNGVCSGFGWGSGALALCSAMGLLGALREDVSLADLQLRGSGWDLASLVAPIQMLKCNPLRC